MKALRAQVVVELRLLSRQAEQILVSIGIPLAVMVFFATVAILPSGAEDPIDFLAPGVLALAVMSSSMVALGIGTGFERHYGVLKRLGTTPLGRPRWILAKLMSVLALELVQIAVLIPTAVVLGWSPEPADLAMLSLVLLLGTAAFSGLGILLAGRLSGTANLAVCNSLYLVLLLFGGFVVPLEELPGILRSASQLLPAAALSESVRGSIGLESYASSLPVLIGWAVVMPSVAARTFRWEP